MGAENRQGDDLRDVIGMSGPDSRPELLEASGGRFDDQERFGRAVHATLPPEQGLELWQNVDAGRETLSDERLRKPRCVRSCRAGHKDHYTLSHWIIV